MHITLYGDPRTKKNSARILQGRGGRRIVDLLGDVPRIELFARKRVPGWDAWGNEIEMEDEP
jgi:hypothetical protein